MTSNVENVEELAYLNRLRASRDSISVHKMQLAKLRAASPLVPVFAFEGIQDKIAYYNWIRRIKPDLQYEPFPCSGKRQVFDFQDMLYRDLGDLRNNVYFFVDRDFDDLRGRQPDDKTFMTDNYSFENYLVSPVVLESILTNELHCHGNPAVRKSINEKFVRVYTDFLAVTAELNFRIYVARTAKINLLRALPQSINAIAIIKIDSIAKTAVLPQDAIVYEREPTQEEIEQAEREFGQLDPVTRYRGKFAMLFFKRWLELLCESYSSREDGLFDDISVKAKAIHTELTIGSFATKSLLPGGLDAFIGRVN